MKQGMAQSTIPQIMNNSGTGYCKMPDGTLIQWGSYTVPTVSLTQIASSGIYSQTISMALPQSFVDTNYTGFATCRFQTGYAIPCGCLVRTKSEITFGLYDFYSRSGSGMVVYWTAIGRWK